MKVKVDSDRRTNKWVILDIQQLQSNRLVGVTNMVIDTKNRGFVFIPQQEVLCLPVCLLRKWPFSIRTSDSAWVTPHWMWMCTDGVWLSIFHLEKLYKWASFAFKHPRNEIKCVLQIISPLNATKDIFFNLELRISFAFGAILQLVYAKRPLRASESVVCFTRWRQ